MYWCKYNVHTSFSIIIQDKLAILIKSFLNVQELSNVQAKHAVFYIVQFKTWHTYLKYKEIKLIISYR